MSEVPETVRTAVADLPVGGATCLEAGAGAGNASLALTEAGAERVYAMTNERDHAEHARERVDPATVAVLEADLTAIPLPDDSVDVITAHALCNVVPPAELTAIFAELSRVARPDARLVVDDYDPLPDDEPRPDDRSTPVADLFAVENAASQLVRGQPALTFYGEDHVRRLCAGFDWTPTRSETLLDPVPWTPDLLDAHADLAREDADRLPAELGEALADRASAVRERAPEGGVDTGRMYSVAFRRDADEE